MKYQSKLGERGQVVIPKAIRDNLGLNKHLRHRNISAQVVPNVWPVAAVGTCGLALR